MSDLNAPPPIRTDGTNQFAAHTMRVRVPGIIAETLALNPDFPAPVCAALEKLSEEISGDQPIVLFPPPAPDYDEWAATLAHYPQHPPQTWLNTEWFFAEAYVYRRILEAVRWWELGRDPYVPHKKRELAEEKFWSFLEQVLSVADCPADERLTRLIQAALWGNRIDLSYAASVAHGHSGSSADLLVDDSSLAVDHLLHVAGVVHVVADNAGTELAADLALIDAILGLTPAQVILHLKMHPTFVSDATPADVLGLIAALDARPAGGAGQLGARLREALLVGTLRLAPDLYWNSAHFLWKMPARLRIAFTNAALIILKGDANYRRAVGDALWAPETPLSEVVRYSTAPILALRTLKSDAVVGLPAGLAERLDQQTPDWRNTGRCGVIQFS